MICKYLKDWICAIYEYQNEDQDVLIQQIAYIFILTYLIFICAEDIDIQYRYSCLLYTSDAADE